MGKGLLVGLYWRNGFSSFQLVSENVRIARARKGNHNNPVRERMYMKVDENLEAKKRDMARAVLAGKSVTASEVDPFEGLTPRQIEKYVQETTGATMDDPFDVKRFEDDLAILFCRG